MNSAYSGGPRKLPARVDGKPQVAPPDVDAIGLDLISLYMDETKQDQRIVTGFLAFGLEPPHRDQTTILGFSAFDTKVLAATAPLEMQGDGIGETE